MFLIGMTSVRIAVTIWMIGRTRALFAAILWIWIAIPNLVAVCAGDVAGAVCEPPVLVLRDTHSVWRGYCTDLVCYPSLGALMLCIVPQGVASWIHYTTYQHGLVIALALVLMGVVAGVYFRIVWESAR